MTADQEVARTFAAEVEDVAGGEQIIAVVVGEMGWMGYRDESKPAWGHIKGRVVTWEEARPMLDYIYDDGYGAPDCQAIYAWTPTRVIFVSQYDGSTNIESIPRNPIDCVPDIPGG